MTAVPETGVLYYDLPWNLRDLCDRLVYGGDVYGFELELLADFVSQ